MPEELDKLSEWGLAEKVETAQDTAINSGVIASDRLGTLYSECLASFQMFLVRCSQSDALNSSLGLHKCFEEYSRLKIWGHQKRAALKSSVPDSLAARTQGRPKLQGVLFEIYEQMIGGLHQIDSMSFSSVAESLGFLADECQNDRVSEARSDVSDDLSTEDESDIVTQIMKSIFESIEELYRVSSLIRRPRLTGRYLRSNLPILDPICQQEYDYVRQKFLLWQKQQEYENLQDQAIQMTSQTVRHFQGEIATPEVIAKRRSAEEDSNSQDQILLHRLAIANTKRRRQLSYWDAYAYQIDVEASDPVDTKPAKLASTVITSSTVPMSAIFPHQADQDRNEITRILYAPTEVGENKTLRVPDPPKVDNTESLFECPYCHMNLDIKEMSIRANWKRHVFRDLRPYICTFSDCPDPERLFLTRHDWIYHEMQLHRRKWVCQSCSRDCASRMEMVEHLRRVHNPSIRDRELTSLLEISERPIELTYADKCTFCHSSMSMKKLLDHMAAHMEELALFSLPPNHEDIRETKNAKPYHAFSQHSKDVHYGNLEINSSALLAFESSGGWPDDAESRFSKTGVRGTYSDALGQAEPNESHYAKPKNKYIHKIYCCNCCQGPWNSHLGLRCGSCMHAFCHGCRTE